MFETVEVYRGFVIRSYSVGRYTPKRAYKCGIERAPTKKLLKKIIDMYLRNPEKYDLHLNSLEKKQS